MQEELEIDPVTHGKTLRLFLVDGDPKGIAVAEVINWTGQVTRVPRSQLARYLQRADSRRTGVYLLTGPDLDMPDRLRVYVGESENVGERLRQHVVDEDKDFWEVAYAISSKDGNITKAHGLFLEALIRGNAIRTGRHLIENIKRNEYVNIPESDRSDMLSFNDQVEVILSALGLDLFSPIRRIETSVSQQIEDPNVLTRRSPLSRPDLPSATPLELVDEKYGVCALGHEIDSKVLVDAGSTARKERGVANSYGALQQRLLDQGVLVQTEASPTLTFAKEYLFDSPSAASAVILNRNDNGRRSWRVRGTSRTLNEHYADELKRTPQSAVAGLEDSL